MRRAPRLLLAALTLAATACGTLSPEAGEIVDLELPDIEAVPIDPPEQTLVFDAAGTQLGVLRTEFREHADIDRIPATLLDAVVVAEDQRFWLHRGLDARGIVRAAVTNVAAGEVEQGGSTITQQLVKNLYMPDSDRDPRTKLREALLARQLEERHSKEQILEDYLNTVYYGNGAYGIQAAAWTYYRKDVADLALHESALLAGLIRSPESLDPQRATQAARDRRDAVLAAMARHGLITREQADEAQARDVVVHPRPSAPETIQPRWVDYVVRYLLDEPTFGADEAERAQRLFGGGLRIHTTLDPDLQAKGEAAVAAHLPDPTDPEAAIAAIDPATGAIRALVGGRDYATSQFDLATQGRRQPGSTFKAFVLTAAVTSGMGPETRVNGNQGVLRTPTGVRWPVHNYSRVSYGTITLAEAVRASVNGAFARLILDLGVGRVAALARAMGVRSPINEDAPIALGGTENCCTALDMASAYGTLANLGAHVPASPIDRIEDADGKVVWRPDRNERRVVDPSAAFVVTQMLRTAVEAGTGTAARIPGWEVAGKTGTVQDYKDAWFVGYTPVVSAAVWVGHPDAPRPLLGVRGVRRVTGGSIPARIWQDFVTSALEGVEPVSFALPDRYYEVVEIDPVTGLLTAPWCGGESRAIPRSIVPREHCPSPAPPPPPRPAPGPTGPATACPEPGPAGEGSPDPAPTPRSEACEPAPDPAPAPAPATPQP